MLLKKIEVVQLYNMYLQYTMNESELDLDLKNLKNDYNIALNTIFGNNRVEVDICHDDRDIVIRCLEREILHALSKYHKQKYNIYWNFRESIYGKHIIINVSKIIKNCKTPDFTDFEKYYKHEYISRLNLILNGSKDPSIKNKVLSIRDNNIHVINDNKVDLKKYKEIRDEIENLRQ